jgi:translation initiation factor IF-3
MQLSAALAAAAALGLDLVEVNPKGQPPVARCADSGLCRVVRNWHVIYV